MKAQIAASSIALAIVACGAKGDGGSGVTSAAPDAPPIASASSGSPEGPGGVTSARADGDPPPDVQARDGVPPPNGAPVGNGIDTYEPLTGCKPSTSTAAEYLQRGELTIAGRPGQIGLAWLVQLKGRAQIGFGGFDPQAKQIARSRGVGSAREHPPHLFATGTDWTLAWFDDEGLAYARPRYALEQSIDIEHLSSVRDVPPEDVALAAAPNGSLLAASTFGAGGQLSLFMFAPVEAGGPKARAIGLTKHAKGPRRPAVAADETGYTLAWVESDGSIAATRMDIEGRELRASTTIASGVGDRTGLALAPLAKGSLLVWTESGEVRARALDAEAQAVSPTWRVGRGQWATVAARGADAVVAWVGEAGGEPKQLLAARVSSDGPASKGRRITSGGAVEAPGVVAVVGDRLAFAWPEKMSALIQSFRAQLRTVDATCFD